MVRVARMATKRTWAAWLCSGDGDQFCTAELLEETVERAEELVGVTAFSDNSIQTVVVVQTSMADCGQQLLHCFLHFGKLPIRSAFCSFDHQLDQEKRKEEKDKQFVVHFRPNSR